MPQPVAPLMKQPERRGNPDQPGPHDRHDGGEKGQQRQQRGPGHAGNEQADAGHDRLRQRGAEDAIDHAANGLAGHGQQMFALFAADAFNRRGQRAGGGHAVAEQEERDEDAQRQLQQAAAQRQAAVEAARRSRVR